MMGHLWKVAFAFFYVSIAFLMVSLVGVTWVRPFWGWPYPLDGWTTRTVIGITGMLVSLALGVAVFCAAMWKEARHA